MFGLLYPQQTGAVLQALKLFVAKTQVENDIKVDFVHISCQKLYIFTAVALIGNEHLFFILML